MLGSSSINPQGSCVLTLHVLFLCAVCSIGPWTAMCKETCVSSAAVRDILTDLASCWIQGTVHSYIELSGIQQKGSLKHSSLIIVLSWIDTVSFSYILETLRNHLTSKYDLLAKLTLC